MPEFPEVYTITQNLKDLIESSVLEKIEYLDYHPNVPKIEEIKALENQKISKVSNVSKNILIEIENNFLRIHLGMTGRIRYSQEKTNFGWDKIRFEFGKGGEKFFLNFTDTRKFGKISLHPSHPLPNKGLNPLNYSEDEESVLTSKIMKSNKEIKDLILDQALISGLGNIYSNDTLFHAGINPQKTGSSLSEFQIKNIIKSANFILNEGIKHKGSSLYDKMYTDIYGKEGNYQNHFQVYNQKSCIICKAQIIKIKIKGRGTYYCPECQK